MLWRILILIVITIIIISRTCVFPLSAGDINCGLEASQNIKLQTKLENYPLVAAIVEPRRENLVKIVRHFLKVMPEYTHFQIYHGTKNAELVYNAFNNEIRSGKLSVMNMGVDNLTIQGYSALLTSKEFWESIKSERVLIFQTDAITCPKSKINIQDFYGYDYVGAPVPMYINILISILFMGKGYFPWHNNYYNGGLSYRTRSKMLKVLSHYPWDRKCTEDIWFCAFLPRVGGRLPNRKVAGEFSYEAADLSVIPWGLHKPRKNYDCLYKICPQVKEIPFAPSHTDYRNLYLL